MPELTEDEIALFLAEIGRLVDQPVNLPDFGSLYTADDSDAGPGLMRASPEDIEAIVVMELQRIAMDQEEAAHEARLARQSEVIAGVCDRANAPPLLPDNAALFLVDADEVEAAVASIAQAAAASRTLSDAFGATADDFQAANAEAVAALEARDQAVQALHEQIAETIKARKDKAAEVRAVLESHRQNIVPEAIPIIQAATKKGAAKNLKNALEAADDALQALDAVVDAADAAEFEDLVSKAETCNKAVPPLIGNVNKMGLSKRGEDRKVLIAQANSTMVRPSAGDLNTLPLDADKDFKAAVEKHAQVHQRLAKMPLGESAESFEALYQETVELRDEVDGLLLILRKQVNDEALDRKKEIASLDAAKNNLPKSTAQQGTPEATELTEAMALYKKAREQLSTRSTRGTRKEFDDAMARARQVLVDAEKAIERTNQLAAERQQRLEDLLTSLREHAQTRIAHAVGAGYFPDDTIRDAAAAVFRKTATEIYKRIIGINDAADQKCVEEFKGLVARAIDFGDAARRIDTVVVARVGGNVLVVPKMQTVVQTIKSSGLGEAAIKEVNSLRTLFRQLGEEYSAVTALGPRVTTATTTNGAVLPEQQLILAQFAAETTSAALHLLDLAGLKQVHDKFSRAVNAVEEAVAEAEAANTEMGQFLTLYKTNRSTNQAVVLNKLADLLNNGTAVVAGGRDAYQCDNEKNGEFSIERELRIDGRRGVLIHAHCKKTGVVKHGNGFHIKLAADRHKGGRGVMLSGPARATLIAEFETVDNLNEKNATQGVMWQ